MFKNYVDTLPLEFTGVSFKDLDSIIIEPETMVPEIMNPVCRDNNPFLPDYGIRGFFQYTGFGQPVFTVDPLGIYLLYITGKPKVEDYPEEDRFRFHDQDSKWSYYWEDNKIGYLTQVILLENKKNKFINED